MTKYKDTDRARAIFYIFMFLVELNYENKKFIKVMVKEKDSDTLTHENFNDNKILREHNKDSYELLKEIYDSEINIPIKLDYNKLKKSDEEISYLSDEYYDGYNIYGEIEKDSIIYNICELVIKNKVYISQIIEENNKDNKNYDPSKYKMYEKFIDYYGKRKNKKYVPLTYILYCLQAYERVLKHNSKPNDVTSLSLQWTGKVKFIKENIKDIFPQWSDYIFEEKDKVSYTHMTNKLLGLHEYIKNTSGDEVNKNYPYKRGLNTFIKGVPGTGKSRRVKQLTSDIKRENILRINIHSDMSSSDIIQGISVNIDKDDKIIYKEKYGLILRHILKAVLNPDDGFAIILEEIQEKALNKLIGSLIYLIEDNKRTSCEYIKKIINENRIEVENNDIDKAFDIIDVAINNYNDIECIDIPNLIEGKDENRKLILPDNIYFFLTTNYRHDKVVIEDNMLRRFSIIEMYPEYKDSVKYENEIISDFLELLNNNIIKVFSDEIHPERMLIGHASWLNIKTSREFYENFIKLIVEFNDIRLIEYLQFKAIFSRELWINFYNNKTEDSEILKCITNIINDIDEEKVNSYFELMIGIQKELRKKVTKQ